MPPGLVALPSKFRLPVKFIVMGASRALLIGIGHVKFFLVRETEPKLADPRGKPLSQ